MQNKKIMNVPREVTTSITCNKCGKTFHYDENESPICEGYHTEEISVCFGYGSFIDGERFIFDICDECFIDFINSFMIKPNKKISYFGE